MKKTAIVAILFCIIAFCNCELKAANFVASRQGIGESINLYLDNLVYPTEDLAKRKTIFKESEKQKIQENAVSYNLMKTSYKDFLSKTYEEALTEEVKDFNLEITADMKNIEYNAKTKIQQSFKSQNSLNFKEAISMSFYKYFFERLEYRLGTQINTGNENLLSEDFLNDARTAKSISNAYTLFEKYGTHVIKMGSYGANLNVSYNATSKYAKIEELSTMTSASNITQTIFNANFGSSMSTINQSLYGANTSKFESQMLAKSYGGNSNGVPTMIERDYATNFQNWKDSISTYPVLTKLENLSFIPIWEFLPNEEFYEFKIMSSIQFSEKMNFANSTVVKLDFDNSQCDPILYLESKNYMRTNQFEIDDNNTGRLTDTLVFSTDDTFNIRKMMELNYNFVRLKLKITMQQINDGYAYIYVLNNYNQDMSDPLWEVKNDLSLTAKEYTYYIDINLDRIIDNRIYLVYRADGSGKDNWINKNVIVNFEYFK